MVALEKRAFGQLSYFVLRNEGQLPQDMVLDGGVMEGLDGGSGEDDGNSELANML